jgi:hypothetical protein
MADVRRNSLYENSVRTSQTTHFASIIKFNLCGEARRQCTYKGNIEVRSRNNFYRGRTLSTTYSECVSVALVMQHAKRTRRILLSYVACVAVQYFSTLFSIRHDFRKTFSELKFLVFIDNFYLKYFSF